MPIIENDRPNGRPDNLEHAGRAHPAGPAGAGEGAVGVPPRVRPSLLRLADQLEQTLAVVVPLLEAAEATVEQASPLRTASDLGELPRGHGATVIDAAERAWSLNARRQWVRVDVPPVTNLPAWTQGLPTLPALVLAEGVEG